MDLRFDPSSRTTVRSAANWALAFAVVALLTFGLTLYGAIADPHELFEDGLGNALLCVVMAILEALAAIAMLGFGLGLRATKSFAQLEEALGLLRTHLRIQTAMMLALPALLVLVPLVLLVGPLTRMF